MKLTKAQIAALEILKDGDESAYGIGCTINTLNALSLKGLVKIRHAPGNLFFPRNADWTITPAGRRALDEVQS